MAPPLLIPDPENATIEELKKAIPSLFARLKSDRVDLADDESTLVQ
jgi:hypothetical protein